MSRSSPTIASDEDMDVCYVLSDDHATTQEAAKQVLLRRARIDWGLRLPLHARREMQLPVKRSYKWANVDGEPNLVPCSDGDPQRDSQWWVFDSISGGDWEMIHE